jgi:hypothetical protein
VSLESGSLGKISRCRGCGRRFQPWKLCCPYCGRALPIVGAVLFLSAVALVCAIACLVE